MYDRFQENRRIENSVTYTAKQEKAVENAKNGILKGYDNQIIADITGLTVEEIEALRNEKE
jgi:ribosomal protein L10